MKPTTNIAVLQTLLISLLLAPIASSSALRARTASNCKIKWVSPCPDGLDAQLPAGTECGSLDVPIDHDNPNGESITLALLRLKANGTSSLGSLFFNPGGPATSATDWMQFMTVQPIWGSTVLASYDLIGVDPRGTGRSNPLQCDPEIYNSKPQVLDSADDAGWAKAQAFSKSFGESCLNQTGQLANFMDSISTMQDFELVRQAIGADKFNYIGLSYGSLLGQAYAELYPENVGRMVLDGNVDHRFAGIAAIMGETSSYQATLQQFFKWCDANDSCALHGEDVASIWANLTAPGRVIPTNCTAEAPCFPQVTAEDVMVNAQPLLITQPEIAPVFPGWSGLSTALAQAYQGDATSLATSLAQPNSSAATSSYAYHAILCQDFGSPLKTAADLKRVLDVAASLAPLTKGFSESMDVAVTCADWPAPVRNPPKALDPARMAQLPPVLLSNSFFDPETSAVWAAGLREQMPTAVNIWRNGSGHTSYFLLGDISKAIDAFLVKGELPADNTVYQS